MVEATCDGAEFVYDGDPWGYASGGADESLLDEAPYGEAKVSSGLGFIFDAEFGGDGLCILVALVVEQDEDPGFEDGVVSELGLDVSDILFCLVFLGHGWFHRIGLA